MKKIRVVAMACFISLLAIVAVHQEIGKGTGSIFAYPESVFQVYSALSQEGLNSEGVAYLAMQENGEDFVNYWTQGCRCIGFLRAYNADQKETGYLAQAMDIMAKLMHTWEKYQKFPRPPYAAFGYGWVSSMDAPTIMVASHMMYELTGEEKYKEFVHELSGYVMKNVSEGGYNVLLDGDGMWPLEYADSSTGLENGSFVLNGSLVGYIGCKIISKCYRNKELDRYLTEVERGYGKKLAEYRYEKYKWTRYMLNPCTVIPPHYIIFEMKLFDAAYELTDMELYKAEKDFRQEAIKEALSLEFTEKGPKMPGGGYPGNIQYVMDRACAPHPYLIDIYATEINFYGDSYGGRKELLDTVSIGISGDLADDAGRFQKGAFLCGDVPKGAKSYEVYTENEGVKYLLFQEDIHVTEKKEKKTYRLEPGFALDAAYEGGIVKVEAGLSEEEEGRIVYRLQRPEQLSQKSYYALELENLSSDSFGLGLLLYDSHGIGAFRYYTKLLPGKNWILFSELGFTDVNDLEDIREVAFRIYTTNGVKHAKFQLGDFCKYESITAMYDDFIHTDFKVNPQ